MAFVPLGMAAASAQSRAQLRKTTGTPTMPPSAVTQIKPADSALALTHFSADLTFETDCWDVHDSLSDGRSKEPDFVLIDVRSPELYARGHVPGAINIPHGKIIESRLAQYAPDTVFVVYCAGPHCNGGHKGAIRLARLGRPVKLMIGGITGWLDEGFELAKS
jgi:rhodanese-related sulfurtransferase